MDTEAHEGRPVDADARAQLAAIASVSRLLDRDDLDHWLFGGWAVDFWVGRITRTHDDADLAVRLGDRAAIHEILIDAGWAHTPEEGEDVGTRYRREGVLLELTFVVEQRGHVLLPFDPEPALWSARPFGVARRELHGATSRVQALEVLRHDKSRPREDDERDGAKDRADYEALSGLGVGEA